jgi:hypothetical protein
VAQAVKILHRFGANQAATTGYQNVPEFQGANPS